MKTILIILLTFLCFASFGQVLDINKSGTTTNVGGNVITTVYFSAGKNTLAYRYYVGTKGHFSTIAEAITWLNANMAGNSELVLDGSTFTIADSIVINLPYALSFRGFAYNTTVINSATGLEDKPMFIVKSDVSFERMTINGSALAGWGNEATENIFNMPTKGAYVEYRNMNFGGGYKGVSITSGSGIFVQNVIISDCIKGVEVNTTDTPSIDIETANIEGCQVGIDLMDASALDLLVTTVNFVNGASDTCIKYNGTTVSWNDITSVYGNNWNRLGVFQSGFNFGLQRDANIVFISNSGYEDKNPHAKINVINNSTTTTVTTATNYYKVNYANGSTYNVKWGLANNKMTYYPTNMKDAEIWISGNIQVNQNNRTLDVAVVKNAGCGTSPVLVNNACLYSPMSCRIPTQNVPYPFSLVAYIPDMALNDYIEIWVTSANSGDVVIIQDLTWYVKAR